MLGQRAALIHLTGLLDPRAQAGVAGQLHGRGEPVDVTNLARDGVAGDPPEPGRAHQDRDVALIGAGAAQILGDLGDPGPEVVDQLKAGVDVRALEAAVCSGPTTDA